MVAIGWAVIGFQTRTVRSNPPAEASQRLSGEKATPVSGKYMAQTVAEEKAPDIIRPFRLDRFRTFDLVNEMGATAASH